MQRPFQCDAEAFTVHTVAYDETEVRRGSMLADNNNRGCHSCLPGNLRVAGHENAQAGR